MSIVNVNFKRFAENAVLPDYATAGAAGMDIAAYIEEPVEKLYNQGLDQMQSRVYADAVESFDEVERQHPYSTWATKAQIMAAYAYYLGNRYDDAILALDRFIQLHPSNRDVAYAMYLKGLSYYTQISDVARDQEITELALNSFKELIAAVCESRFESWHHV